MMDAEKWNALSDAERADLIRKKLESDPEFADWMYSQYKQYMKKEGTVKHPKTIRVGGHLYRKADLFWRSLETPEIALMDSHLEDHVNYTDAYEGEFDTMTYMADDVSMDATFEDAQAIADKYGLTDFERPDPDEDPAEVWDDLVQALAASGKAKTFVTGKYGTYNLGYMDGKFGWIIELDEEAMDQLREQFYGPDEEDY